MRLVLSGAIVLVLASRVATAHAADTSDALQLRWSAPEGCPSTDTVRAAILRNVDARASQNEVLEADARVEQTSTPDSPNTQWRVYLRTRRGGSTGEREIESTTCAGLAEATAVVLALALVRPPPAAPTSAPAPAAPSTTPSPSRPAPERDAVATRRSANDDHAVALGASVAGDAATLPSVAVGGSLTLAWTHGRARIELDARRWGSHSASLATTGAGARFTMTSVGGRACFAALKSGSFDLSPCAGADANLISAPGFGAATNYAPNAAWATITGGALARISLRSWLAVRSCFDAVVPLSRPTFVVENEGSVHRAAAFGGAASLGLEALFL